MTPDFNAAVSTFALQIPLVTVSVTLEVQASLGSLVSVAGLPVIGNFSSAVDMAVGTNVIEVAVTCEAQRATYQVHVTRGVGLSQVFKAPVTVDDEGQEISQAFAECGTAVAANHRTIVLGCPGSNNGGAVHVFSADSGFFSYAATLTPASPSDSFFGRSVAIDDEDNIVVGAPGAGAFEGAAYVFRRDSDTWVRQQRLASPSSSGLITQELDLFGNSVSISGVRLVVGAPGEDSSTSGIDSEPDELGPGSGAAYSYVWNGLNWVAEAYFKASNSGQTDQFGANVALSGNRLAVAATGEDSGEGGVGPALVDETAPDSGAVYLFEFNESWVFTSVIKHESPNANDVFGSAIGLNGDTLVIGAPADDSSSFGIGGDPSDNGSNNSGGVFVYRFNQDSVKLDSYLKPPEASLGVRFGSSVAIFGDVIAVGAPLENGGGSGLNPDPSGTRLRSGALYTYRRVDGQWANDAYLKASFPETEDQFGSAVVISALGVIVASSSEDSTGDGASAGSGNDNNNAQSSGICYMFE